LGNILSTGLLVAGWGYFLYQGAIDPEGIAKSLWPIFGISNQLLAVIAFCLGTTILIKSGRAKYAWVTVIPLVFLAVVTFVAGWMKIFSAQAAGFIPAIAKIEAEIAGGTSDQRLAVLKSALYNARLDVVVVAMLMALVALITLSCVWQWWKWLRGSAVPVLRESPYVSRVGSEL
jgi:carbon starvation protein